MDGSDLLRRFCIGDPALADESGSLWTERLDARTRALITVGALVAVSAPEASVRGAVDAATGVGVRPDEVIAVLDGVVPVVGMPRAVAAAPRIAAALGYAEELCVSDDGR
ncbi:hypothetical protein LK09_15250 [Microbacterium mangrovi]|uniref:Carboxymuconolactone decarboxylase-like domain-containing protein n=1 Tax=Microbacterium mangrovi TaxID=1348253 RepID=A0A0B2A449_9MICO|nr:carboxymuconolactone decarboxylase family protein [Microbacterium mangrovi]KHK96348.1 hypothetical protein LK09_15250 [Microbacterium mangrovi]